MVRMLKSIRSREEYVNLLKMFYGFFSPIEAAVRNHIDEKTLDDIHERRQATLIINDLKALGYGDHIPVSPFVPRIDSDLRAFGALYVGEGSTLGGSIIAKMLRDNPNLHDCTHAITFFDGYQDRTMAMWKKFQRHLDESFQADHQQKEIVSAATETFDKMKAWLTAN
jgi:heme oxygenase